MKKIDLSFFGKYEEKTLVSLAIFTLFLSFLFSSFSLTGFSIANSSVKESNLAGMIFFILSILICFFIYLREKK